jgi:predicted cupin superfamily sugar epimerase
MKVKELIEKYNMQEHPEGGYYMVSHGFSFDEFELFDTEELKQLKRIYPEIKKLFLY